MQKYKFNICIIDPRLKNIPLDSHEDPWDRVVLWCINTFPSGSYQKTWFYISAKDVIDPTNVKTYSINYKTFFFINEEDYSLFKLRFSEYQI